MEQPLSNIAPHNEDAERSILGSILISQSAAEAALERLHAEDFYSPRHRSIYETMEKLYARGMAIDIVTLGEAMQRAGNLDAAGGINYLTELSLYTPTTANVEQYIDIVEERAVMRQLIVAGSAIIQDAQKGENSLEEMLNDAERLIYNISMKKTKDSLVHIKKTLE